MGFECQCDPNLKPVANWKCIVFSLAAAAQYAFIDLSYISIFLWMACGVVYAHYAKCQHVWSSGLAVGALFGLALSLLPEKSKWILFFILYSCYIIMAWFDHLFGCKRKLGLSYLAHMYVWAKPHESFQLKAFYQACNDVRHQILMTDRIVIIGTVLSMWIWLQYGPGLPNRWKIRVL